jgi:hypothetical protein
MAIRIRPVEYFYTMVEDRPGEAFRLLTSLAADEVNLLAFNIVPVGANATQLVLFPEHAAGLARAAERGGFAISSPQQALLIQGDDELGALVGVHQKLFAAGVNVYASNGVNDGKGSYGYVVYVRPEGFADAVRALGL